jgi:hypothetical protein
MTPDNSEALLYVVVGLVAVLGVIASLTRR